MLGGCVQCCPGLNRAKPSRASCGGKTLQQLQIGAAESRGIVLAPCLCLSNVTKHACAGLWELHCPPGEAMARGKHSAPAGLMLCSCQHPCLRTTAHNPTIQNIALGKAGTSFWLPTLLSTCSTASSSRRQVCTSDHAVPCHGRSLAWRVLPIEYKRAGNAAEARPAGGPN